MAWASRTLASIPTAASVVETGSLELVPTVSLDDTKAVAPATRRATTSQRKAMVALPAPGKARPIPRPSPAETPPVVEPAPVEPPIVETPPAPPSRSGDGADGGHGTGAGEGNGRGVVAQPAPAPAPLLPRVGGGEPRRTRDEGRTPFTPPVIVASSVGAIGLAVGAIGTGFGDGPVQPGVAIVGAGIGAVGLLTAGLLMLIQPDDAEPKQVAVGVGPGSIAARGTF